MVLASVDKYTNEVVSILLRHNERSVIHHSNADIDPERSKLNYSFEMQHGSLSDYEYYRNLIDEKYIYGRGTAREKETVTCCSWIITAPQEIVGNGEKERTFFEGCFDFVSNRYGRSNIINNTVHYDEAGSPHIHIMFCPVTGIDHEKVHFKTVKTTKTVRLNSGRVEFESRFKVDDYGERVPVKNYAKMADYYDQKISANDVINKAELQSFHKDLQTYLDQHGIEGKVVNGKTGGTNFTVKELKEFTAETGLRLDEVKEMMGGSTLLESFVEQCSRVSSLETLLAEKNTEISSLKEQIKELDHLLTSKQQEVDHANNRIRDEMKSESISSIEKEKTWGHSPETWGNCNKSTGWGSDVKISIDEKTW